MLRHLAKHQLVAYTPYQPVHLTPIGEKIALETIRHHRLLELYLMESLGYGWEQVHSEAERLEHHISEEFEASIERLLGFPAFDPHGDPIPTRDGRMPPLVTATLAAQEDGARLVIRRVTDEDERPAALPRRARPASGNRRAAGGPRAVRRLPALAGRRPGGAHQPPGRPQRLRGVA